MRAAAIFGHGGLDVLGVTDLHDPSPAMGEILVEVKAAAVNHLDLWVRRGGRGEMSFPHVVGSDGAGVIRKLGEGVSALKEGQEVVLYPGLVCMRCSACLHGQHSLCEHFAILGAARWGTCGELVTLPAYAVAPRPPHMSWEETAALTVDHLTAWRMVMTRAGVHAGQTVLIHGIGGGVALAALQWAKLVGAVTIVTSSSDAKLDCARALGADHSLNYQKGDVGTRVRQIADGGVDAVIDSVGSATWKASFEAVRRGGTIVNCGITSGGDAVTNVRTLYWNQLNVLGSTLGSLGEWHDMLRAAAQAKLKPVIDSVLPLQEIRAAQAKMEEGKQFGKIVLRP